MNELTPAEREALTAALHDGPEPPAPSELGALAGRAEQHGRTFRARRRAGIVVLAAAVVAAVFLVPAVLRGGEDPSPADPGRPPASDTPTIDVPADCTSSDHTEPAFLRDEPVWIRFCPGPAGATRWAQMPADVIEPDAPLLAAWRAPHPVYRCATDGQDFRAQLGLPGGSVGTIAGDTFCNYSWLYDALMRAYGRHYAEEFSDSSEAASLACPSAPDRPGDVDRDGPSAALELGIAMPLTATRGLVCTWHAPTNPQQHALTPAQAETVRVQMHAVPPGTGDCAVDRRDPSYVVVLADRTGTQRAISLQTSDCGSGIGFPGAMVTSSFANGPDGVWLGPIFPE